MRHVAYSSTVRTFQIAPMGAGLCFKQATALHRLLPQQRHRKVAAQHTASGPLRATHRRPHVPREPGRLQGHVSHVLLDQVVLQQLPLRRRLEVGPTLDGVDEASLEKALLQASSIAQSTHSRGCDSLVTQGCSPAQRRQG